MHILVRGHERQVMRDDDRRLVLTPRLDRRVDRKRCRMIQRRRRLVQHKHRRIQHESTRQGYALLLAATERDAPRAEHGVEAMRQRTHDRRQLHRRTHRLESLRRHGMRREILAQAPLQYERLLADTHDMRTVRGTRANVDAIDQHTTLNRVVQPRHNGRDGALARATRAHQVRRALQLHRHVAQHTHIRPRGIRHAHTLQRHAPLHRRQRLRSRHDPARRHAAEP